MAKRAIFEVYAKIIDANGTYNIFSGYPKVFDSKLFGNDIEKTRLRATGEFHNTIGSMCTNDTRQQQTVMLMGSDGLVIDRWTLGNVSDVPDSE